MTELRIKVAVAIILLGASTSGCAFINKVAGVSYQRDNVDRFHASARGLHQTLVNSKVQLRRIRLEMEQTLQRGGLTPGAINRYANRVNQLARNAKRIVLQIGSLLSAGKNMILQAPKLYRGKNMIHLPRKIKLVKDAIAWLTHVPKQVKEVVAAVGSMGGCFADLRRNGGAGRCGFTSQRRPIAVAGGSPSARQPIPVGGRTVPSTRRAVPVLGRTVPPRVVKTLPATVKRAPTCPMFILGLMPLSSVGSRLYENRIMSLLKRQVSSDGRLSLVRVDPKTAFLILRTQDCKVATGAFMAQHLKKRISSLRTKKVAKKAKFKVIPSKPQPKWATRVDAKPKVKKLLKALDQSEKRDKRTVSTSLRLRPLKTAVVLGSWVACQKEAIHIIRYVDKHVQIQKKSGFIVKGVLRGYRVGTLVLKTYDGKTRVFSCDQIRGMALGSR